jgi:hypothetical protein
VKAKASSYRIYAMDGLTFSSSYRKYKSNQARFTTWLKQSADKCTKTHSSKAGALSSDYIVRVTELEGLARIVATNLAPECIPLYIVETLRDVVNERKKFLNIARSGTGKSLTRMERTRFPLSDRRTRAIFPSPSTRASLWTNELSVGAKAPQTWIVHCRLRVAGSFSCTQSILVRAGTVASIKSLERHGSAFCHPC